MDKTEVAIVAAKRTPIGTFCGTLSEVPAPKLGAIVIKSCLEATGLSPDAVDEVIMGNVLQAGLGQNPARQSAVEAGIPDSVPSFTVNKVCGSGLKAVILGYQSIVLGDAEIVVAGGMESMSRAPYLLESARTGYRMGNGELVDCMLKDGLWCSLTGTHMGFTAENLAAKYGISREEQDSFALESQSKALSAIKSGRFAGEIVPVRVPARKGDPIVFDRDEHPREGLTLEKLANLKPAFKQGGTVTAGNSSGINDGASCVVLMTKENALSRELPILGVIKSYASVGVDPSIMGIAPARATRQALLRAGLSLDQMELIEANEAFAVQALAVERELGWNRSRVNVNGGAIALGHPIGASGARILTTLLHEMNRRRVRFGLATLCIGGGQGLAMVIEREEHPGGNV